MNAILLAVIFTVAVGADFFWEPFAKKVSNEKRSNRLKVLMGIVLLILGWWQAVLQHRRDAAADKDADSMRADLSAANRSLSNSVETVHSMQEELVRFRKQSDQDAISLVEQLLRAMVPAEGAQFATAGFAMMTGREKQAEIHLRNCLKLNPNNSRAHNNLGIILRAQGKTNAAEEEFKLAARDASNGAAAMNYTRLLAAQHRQAEEVEVMSRVSDLSELGDDEVVNCARFLAANIKDIDSFRYLDHYIKTAAPPSLPQVQSVMLYWSLPFGEQLSADQKSSATNWPQYFPSEQRQVVEEAIKHWR